MTAKKKQEILLKGTAVSPGIAIGNAYILHHHKEIVREILLLPSEVPQEVKRYREALKKSRKEITLLKKELEKEQAWDGATILEAHLQMLQDPVLCTNIEEEIALQERNAEFILKHTLEIYKKRFIRIQDRFFQERYKDLQDVTRRILRHLQKDSPYGNLHLPAQSIIFADELVPSDTATATSSGILGFVTKKGGKTCHAAIVAKAQRIPFVSNIELSSCAQLASVPTIVDGYEGCVILNPTAHTLNKYRTLEETLSKNAANTKLPLSAHSLEMAFDLYANVDALDDLTKIPIQHLTGIGLFRSESLITTRGIPSEDEQFLFYKKLLETAGSKPVIIRTFDIGGDKLAPFSHEKQEDNPFLGCRAVRLQIKQPDLLISQLRALIRASHYGNLNILLPLITCSLEIVQIKELFFQQNQILKGAPVRWGCMIEVPSAALTVDLLAPHVDFFSIGTNDLVQYTMAVDRGNSSMSYLYQPTHPSILRLLLKIVQDATRHQRPVTLCGEMAADPCITPLLVGLGIRSFSVAPVYLAMLKENFNRLSQKYCDAVTKEALQAKNAQEVLSILNHAQTPKENSSTISCCTAT